MGYHYIPKYYLSGFSTSSSSGPIIWVYEKNSASIFSTSINNVAKITRFYSDDIEKYLANQVEGPANSVITKIRDRQPISDEDKTILAQYMVTMWKRVPKGKERLEKKSSEIFSSVLDRNQNELNDLLIRNPNNKGLRRALEELKWIRWKLESDDEYRADVINDTWLKILYSEMTPKSMATLSHMTWQILTYDKELAFLTSDNPLFFFSDIGIGNERSEVTFPLSSNMALWGTWREDIEEGYFPAKVKTVHQINRRTVSASTRYVFHASEADWVRRLVHRNRHNLRRLQKP